MQRSDERRREHMWASALIVVGGIIFGAVVVFTISMLRDPGGAYDGWVPDDEHDGPEASYDWISEGVDVRFEDTSAEGAAGIERWEWDFGDGTRASQPSPTHGFTDGGEWDVTLEVVDGNGRSSTAEGTVELEVGAPNQGDGSIGLNDLADQVIATVERTGKGAVVVGLVVASLLILSLTGGRLVRQGVRLMRPVPDGISVKLRPKHLELDLHEFEADTRSPVSAPSTTFEVAAERELVGS